MNILVYGAGPLGTLLSSRLHDAGHDVSLLARGQRLADLHKHGVVLVDTETGKETVTRPKIVESLEIFLAILTKSLQKSNKIVKAPRQKL